MPEYNEEHYTVISDKDYPIPISWSPETGVVYLPEHMREANRA